MADEKLSRSQQKRIAAQKGEPVPTTSERVIKTDLDLPPAHRTEGNLWRSKYFELLNTMRGAHKGIARLRRRVVALQQYTEEVSERYLQEKTRFNDELMEANYKADQRQMENDHLRRQLEDVTSQRDGAVLDNNRLMVQIEKLEATLRLLGTAEDDKILLFQENSRLLNRLSDLDKTLKELEKAIISRGTRCAVDITGDPDMLEDPDFSMDVKIALKTIDCALKLGIQRNNERNELEAKIHKLEETLTDKKEKP